MYENIEIRTIQEVRELFPNEIADEYRWILCGTGGIHGSDLTINNAEYIVRDESGVTRPIGNARSFITVLVVEPGNIILRWGEIQVNLDDLNYLRKLVRSSLDAIVRSQGGNI